MTKTQKLIAGALLTVAAVLGLREVSHTEVVLSSLVTPEAGLEVTQRILNLPRYTSFINNATLTINSPGGVVSVLEFIKEVIKDKKVYLTTKVPVFAASAAADLFLMGETRLMGADATVIIHEARMKVGDSYVTYSDLKSILDTGLPAANSKLSPKVLVIIKTLLPKKVLTALVEKLEKSHEGHIEFLMRRLNMPRQEVLTKLLIPNIDVELNLTQALELGVATGVL